MLRLSVVGVAALLLSATACDTGRHSAAGFRLASTGDIERGKATFVALECNKCHQVSGVDLPKPTVDPPVGVMLGGETLREPTDGYLVASIVNPSHVVVHGTGVVKTADGKSRMPVYADITVRQMTDVVAFLQSHYTVPPLPRRYPMVN